MQRNFFSVRSSSSLPLPPAPHTTEPLVAGPVLRQGRGDQHDIPITSSKEIRARDQKIRESNKAATKPSSYERGRRDVTQGSTGRNLNDALASYSSPKTTTSINKEGAKNRDETKIDVRHSDHKMAAAAAVKRSKSDVQDFLESEEVNKPKLTSRIVQRSKSFQKLFNTSILSNRSREYSFQWFYCVVSTEKRLFHLAANMLREEKTVAKSWLVAKDCDQKLCAKLILEFSDFLWE